jgi:hypothetical protein
MTALAPAQRYGITTSAGSSRAAHDLRARFSELMLNFIGSSLGMGGKGVLNELDSVAEECKLENWDGYGAKALAPQSYETARQFLEAFPLGTPAPSLSASPLGFVTIEWYRSRNRTLSVSVDADSQLHYAALLGPAKQYGREPFYGDVPASIQSLINQVLV